MDFYRIGKSYSLEPKDVRERTKPKGRKGSLPFIYLFISLQYTIFIIFCS
jgi:hypothetical protein